MNKKKFLIILILLIFTVGMVMGSASASHTFKDKGYKYKMSTKEVKKLKKYAKKNGRCYTHVKVSKTKNKYSYEKLKVGKKYTYDGKFKVLKLVKVIKGKGVGDGGYLYKIKQYGKMNCAVQYYKGKYSYHATAY
ncbi:MAG: hypothetical protein UHW60_03955 [Methanobrevibacter sp.]|nr:hypothetical protein [Methanobrevibacter sp.]